MSWSRPCFTFCIWLVSSYVYGILNLEPGVYVCTCTQKIANICDCSSSPPFRWRHDFPSTIFCIHNFHDKLYCSMNNYRWKCRHFRSVLCHSIKVNWSSWIMNVNRWDIALILLVALVHTRPTVVAKLSSMRLEIYIVTFFIISDLNKYKSIISGNQLSTRHM